MALKSLKIPVDEKVFEQLEQIAKKLGMKTKAYVQYVLGQHVQAMEAVTLRKEDEEETA